MASTGITVLHATPNLLDTIAAGADGGLPTLRLVVSGGDVLTAGHLRRLRQFTDAEVVNAYGTTETPQLSSYSVVLGRQAPYESDLPDHTVLPVGHGVAGRQMIVTTASGEPVAAGQWGEVVVRGPNMALGYIGDVSREDRFAQDPAGPPEQRIYRTGDRGRLDNDGQLVVDGRLDRQISLAGQRVELAEIEAVAKELTGVTAACAELVDHDAAPALSLAVAAAPGRAIDAATLRTHLRARLPRPAVPAHLRVETESLVLAARRKPRSSGSTTGAVVEPARSEPAAPVTRPQPDPTPGHSQRPQPGGVRRAASTRHTVRALAALVEEVLGHPVLPRQNFFDAGFTSRTLTGLHPVISQRFSVDIPVTALFSHPSVESLADLLHRIQARDSS